MHLSWGRRLIIASENVIYIILALINRQNNKQKTVAYIKVPVPTYKQFSTFSYIDKQLNEFY